LVPPLRKQSGTFLPDKQCEFIEIIDDVFLYLPVPVYQGSRDPGQSSIAFLLRKLRDGAR